MPLYVTIDSVSPNSASVSWTPGYNETAWNMQYREISANNWSEIIQVTSPDYHISGLMAETEYQVRVQANCLADSSFKSEYQPYVQTKKIDSLSEWTDPVNFITLGNVGINQIFTSQNIVLQPNPADNYIDLHVNSEIEVKEAAVFNTYGQLIQTVMLTDNHARINLNNIASGMYIVRISSKHATATKKFIKR